MLYYVLKIEVKKINDLKAVDKLSSFYPDVFIRYISAVQYCTLLWVC